MRKIFFLTLWSLAIFSLSLTVRTVLAEQSTYTPESGSTSRIKNAYDSLVSKGINYGLSSAADWSNDWGTYWNRIMNAAFWKPEGTALESDVLSGKTFYAENGRSSQTGTITARNGDNASTAQTANGGINYFTPISGYYDGNDRVFASDAEIVSLNANLISTNIKNGATIFGISGDSNVVDTSSGDAEAGNIISGKKAWVKGREITGSASGEWIDYSKQSLIQKDDYAGAVTDEESTWTNTAGTAEGGVWKDERTGLYWSANLIGLTNGFTIDTCPFFSTTPRSNYDGSSADCGNAINYCATLDLANGGSSSTDWYLPTQKEYMQAYIDGIYKKTNTTWVTTSYFWSTTEQYSGPNYAWNASLHNGSTGKYSKSIYYSIRCIRRD